MKKLYDLRTNLIPFIPEKALDEVVLLLRKHPIHLGLMAPRSRVYGDYRASQKINDYHKITINGDLNKYAFLLVFLHEYAHLLVFVRHGANVKPHGSEWKTYCRQLFYQFIQMDVFPEDLRLALRNHMVKMPYTIGVDSQLMHVLERYNPILRRFS